jgi:LmbE family N-acetylglucosaminyl deacetylase
MKVCTEPHESSFGSHQEREFGRLRASACSLLERGFRRTCAPLSRADWQASALIFAPHADDETLGCGGIAAKKIASGVEVRFVFVTDSAASHPEIDRRVLQARREAEALAAVSRLGAPATHVTFLQVPDGGAMDHVARAVRAIAEIVSAWRPQSVFVTHAKEPPLDHRAVNQSVLAGLARCGHRVTVFEYPVWLWYHWPWVSFRNDLPAMRRTTLKQTAASMMGTRLLYQLNARAFVGDVLGTKREALAAHASQTMRPTGRGHWPILSDLSGGDFLLRLLAEYELFNRYELST